MTISPTRMLRRLYDWVMSFARSRYGAWALFLVAIAESSFFPVPPDFLLIALAVGNPRRSLRFAAITALGSIIGAGIGYWIGLEFYQRLGRPIVEFYGAQDSYRQVQALYREWDSLAVGIAGFTPIPFKVFTIAAGAFQLELLPFFLASTLSRGARFFLVGGLIWWFGPSIQTFIERYLNWLAVLAVVLFVGGFLTIRYAIN